MRLQPKRPPGRSDRKVATYSSEILQLRVDGYTYEAILEALLEFGIKVSESTLRREVRRQQKQPARPNPGIRVPSPTPQDLAPPVPGSVSAGALLTTSAHGRDIAEAFFTAHPSNPLLSTRENS